MRQLYKSYISLLAKWPKDPTKEGERCFPTFLRNEVNRIFQEKKLGDTNFDKNTCTLRLKALQRIYDNTYLKAYPHNYKSGIFGCDVKKMEEFNSTESRQQMGLEKKPSIWKRLTRK